MCAPVVGAVSAISGIASAVGGAQSAQGQADAANKAATEQYEYQNAQRELEWRNTLNREGYKRVQYEEKINENSLAANRAYAGEQQRLNEIYQKASFGNQDGLAKLLGSQGKNLAAGMSGKSAQRSNNMMMAALGRQQSQTAASLTSARQMVNTNNRNTRNQLISTNNDAYSQVAITPQPGMAAPPPQMQAGPNPLSTIGAIGSAVAGGMSAMGSLSAPDAGNIPTKGSSNLFGGGGFNTDWGSMSNSNQFDLNSYFKP